MLRLVRHRSGLAAACAAGATLVVALPTSAGAASLSATPGVAARGERVALTVRGFTPNSRVTARLYGAPDRRLRVDGRGRASFTMQLRRTTRTGSRVLQVRSATRRVTTKFTVLSASRTSSRLAALSGGQRVLLRPASGRPGAKLTLHVSGFRPRAKVAVRLAGASLASTRTGSRGSLTLRPTTPTAAVGRRQLSVTSATTRITLPFEILAALPGPATPPPPPQPPLQPFADAVLVGAGDIAGCNNQGDETTAALLDGIAGTVFTLGDNVYPTGTLSNLNACYAPSWGRHKARTRPVPGNHEYDASGNTGYFDYFGASAGPVGKGYYSYDLGAWHVVVLNSNCALVGGCHAGSEQEGWLRADLAASAKRCTVAMMHHPRFSSGVTHGSNTAMTPFWQALYNAGAELVLAGHDHHYERFAPMNAAGAADGSFGLRSFVVGSGGFSHYALGTLAPNSESRNADTFGVLKLTLHDGSYDWQFVPQAGRTYTDSGSGSCHGVPGA